ncbi:PIN domain-containing protein [Acinetobacter radioresistens]|uniref:PIN domain-containing protein n=1 Tax=Acinetobacter radioresistens TaxID=40216 RepID=UPI003B287F05
MLKLLKSFEVSLPVYQMESHVSYQAIRQPSVFEGMILNLAVKYKNRLGQFSLSQVCERFKIEPFLIQKALYSLIDNEMLERCDTDLTATQIKDLVVTTLGKDLYDKNEMPSENKNTELERKFYPLINQFINDQAFKLKTYDAQAPFVLPQTLFDANIEHVNQMIRDMLEQATEKQFEWKKPNTNISEVNSHVSKTLVHNLPIRIALNNHGHLGYDAKGNSEIQQVFSTWLEQTNPEVVWEHILSKTFQQLENHLPDFEWSSVLDVTLAENNLLDDNALIRVYSEKSPNKVNDKPEIILSAQAKLAKVQGKTLTLPFSTILPEGFQSLYFYKDQTATLILKGNTNIFYAKQPRLVALQIKLSDEQVWANIQTEVLRWNTTGSLDLLAFTRYFLSENEVFQHAPNLTMKEAVALHEAMKKVNNSGLRSSVWLDKIQRISNLSELTDFRKTFSHLSLAPQWAETTLFVKLIEDAFENGKSAGTTLDKDFTDLIQVHKSLKSQINPELLNPNQPVSAKHSTKISIKALVLLDEWLNCYDELVQKHPEILTLCGKIKKQQQHFVDLKECIAQSFAPVREDGKKIAILDTSYLMDHSDELTHLSRDYFVVIPKVVLHELDGLKKGKDADEFSEEAQKARRAIRSIEHLNLTSEHIEDSHDEFITLIAKTKTTNKLIADEKILSVAFFYRLNNCELFSRDVNMRNLAKALDICSRSEYQQKPALNYVNQ